MVKRPYANDSAKVVSWGKVAATSLHLDVQGGEGESADEGTVHFRHLCFLRRACATEAIRFAANCEVNRQPVVVQRWSTTNAHKAASKAAEKPEEE